MACTEFYGGFYRVLLGNCTEEPLQLEDKSMHTLVVTLVPLRVAILLLSIMVLFAYVCNACTYICICVCMHAYT